MIFEAKTKTQPVSKEQVWASWKRIKKGGKGMGIDQVSTSMIEANPRKYLYPLWNRLASGSYFPPAVREVAIPKGEGKERILGIPTVLEQEATIKKYKMNNKVHEKGYKKKPLTDKQKATNREKSRTRARVEHVFGFMEQSMNKLYLNTIGIKRATGVIGLINLTYNLFRYEQIVRLQGISMS